jgi:hypothetical protein
VKEFTVEVGENKKLKKCECCARESNTGHGFVYREDNPCAVYYAGWSEAHRERGVTIAVAIGRWDDGSTTDQRTCFGINVREGEDQLDFEVIGPEDSPWPNTKLLGPMLGREEGLKSPLIGDVFTIVEEIVRGHPEIREFLHASM